MSEKLNQRWELKILPYGFLVLEAVEEIAGQQVVVQVDMSAAAHLNWRLVDYLNAEFMDRRRVVDAESPRDVYAWT